MDNYRVKIALAYKVYFIVLISVAFCAVFIGVLNYYDDRVMLSNNLGSGLEKIANTAALRIDADELDNIKSINDPFYIKIRYYLLDVKKRNEIKAPLYILKRLDPNNASLLVTTETGSLVGTKYKLNPTLKLTLNAGRSHFSPIYTDKNGTWISAYAPINDRAGKTVAALEMNYHVDYYVKQLRYRLFEIILLCVCGFLIGALLGLPLLRPILKSIDILSAAAIEMQKGNYDYEIKLKSSDEIGQLASAFEKMRNAIKNYIEQLKEAWINEKKTHLESVKALAEAIAIREPHMKGHIERVSRYAELIAKELGLSEEEVETIKYGCMLHDVGKIGIDINILNKPAELSKSEYEKIKKHPFLGAQVVKGVEFLEKARDAVLYHQERYDGKGYPKGLKGEEIPLPARIVTLVDAYDAMTSDRPYRKGFDKNEILSKIKEESGKQFDPKVVEAFLKVKDKL